MFCALAVLPEKGRKLNDFPVETNGQALVEAVRMIPGHKRLVIEEGLQSAWLYETLSPHVDKLVVAGIARSRGPKSDKREIAYTSFRKHGLHNWHLGRAKSFVGSAYQIVRSLKVRSRIY